ncbi:MAG: BlaI/MecI/CopY family transcriptional regulator [Desulfitobacteriaceae bacterium]|nr:BlaI/MecI/CopY family transcriptional regulator [Desulfitobacteriaceae bacterium]MDD4346741.1 BlaI/MecI/CopY family transcriptional regulator [Desulfitobacteriaceae bacterium]
MEQYKLGEMEQRFADLIWEHEPVSSRTLTELCAEAFNWKRTTTYTMLKRLCERELFQNQSGMVSALMSKNDFLAGQGEQFLNDTFDGSLPQFFAAFTRRNKLSKKEISEIQRLIDEHEEG